MYVLGCIWQYYRLNQEKLREELKRKELSRS
jgi:hypothetical protein